MANSTVNNYARACAHDGVPFSHVTRLCHVVWSQPGLRRDNGMADAFAAYTATRNSIEIEAANKRGHPLYRAASKAEYASTRRLIGRATRSSIVALITQQIEKELS